MADRYLDLKNIAAMRKLTRDEQHELNAWTAAKEAAAKDPRVLEEKAKTARQFAEVQQRAAAANTERAFQTIFSTKVGNPPMLALDNEAARREIISWLHPSEQVNNPREWFLAGC